MGPSLWLSSIRVCLPHLNALRGGSMQGQWGVWRVDVFLTRASRPLPYLWRVSTFLSVFWALCWLVRVFQWGQNPLVYRTPGEASGSPSLHLVFGCSLNCSWDFFSWRIVATPSSWAGLLILTSCLNFCSNFLSVFTAPIFCLDFPSQLPVWISCPSFLSGLPVLASCSSSV